MARFQKQNLRHIKNIFEEKTGVDLNPDHKIERKRPVRMTLVLAAAIVLCLALAAFTQPVFSPLDGDELSLSGTYCGNGIVTVYVENGSDKVLKFQEKVKLMRWANGEEVESTGGRVTIENAEFPPHSSGTMTVDLSEAYDVRAREEAFHNWEPYYLLLTNQDFLFGQDWICSFSFGEKPETPAEETQPEETLPPEPVEEDIHAQIEAELRFYFEDAYANQLMAMNEQNFVYMQKVSELLARFDGTIVPPAEPSLIVGRTPEDVVFDESYPLERQYELVGENYHIIDGYGRIVAGTNSPTGWEHALTLKALVPTKHGEVDGGTHIPLIYLFTYEVSAIQAEDAHAFIYGQILSFNEMEPYKVYEDEQYVVYEMTDLFYTDLDAYIDYNLSVNEHIYCDDQVRQRVHNIYDYYKDKENLESAFYYNLPKE